MCTRSWEEFRGRTISSSSTAAARSGMCCPCATASFSAAGRYVIFDTNWGVAPDTHAYAIDLAE